MGKEESQDLDWLAGTSGLSYLTSHLTWDLVTHPRPHPHKRGPSTCWNVLIDGELIPTRGASRPWGVLQTLKVLLPSSLWTASSACSLSFIKFMGRVKGEMLCPRACVILGEDTVPRTHHISDFMIQRKALEQLLSPFHVRQNRSFTSSVRQSLDFKDSCPVPLRLIFSRQMYVPQDTPLYILQLSYVT